MTDELDTERSEGREGPRQTMDYSPITTVSRRPGLMGPVFLITLGIVFLIGEFVPEWGVRKTWPLLLVVVGVLKLVDSMRPPRPPEGPRL
jgi:hypothetical protein